MRRVHNLLTHILNRLENRFKVECDLHAFSTILAWTCLLEGSKHRKKTEKTIRRKRNLRVVSIPIKRQVRVVILFRHKTQGREYNYIHPYKITFWYYIHINTSNVAVISLLIFKRTKESTAHEPIWFSNTQDSLQISCQIRFCKPKFLARIPRKVPSRIISSLYLKYLFAFHLKKSNYWLHYFTKRKFNWTIKGIKCSNYLNLPCA